MIDDALGYEIAMVAMAAVGAGTAISSAANQQAEMADYQAAQAQADANAEKSAAEVQAEKIRKMARIQAGGGNRIACRLGCRCR